MESPVGEGAAGCRSGACLAPWVAVGTCATMAVLYVGLLYAPSLLLRLPPPASLRDHMLRRFAGAIAATCLSLFLSYRLLLSIEMDSITNATLWLNAFGMRSHHWIQAIIFPLLLTSSLYLGPLTMEALKFYDDWREGYQERFNVGGGYCSEHATWDVLYTIRLLASDVLAWRNYVLAPLTEEIVFRACMIPILLCAGFQPVTIIFLCPLFFGLAHVNHFWELVHLQNCDKKRALLIVGAQLGYTTVFGWYASFLHLRTGNVFAPLAAHVFCNIMGFPDLQGVFQRGLIFIFLVGVFGFFFMLAPATVPSLYNNASELCYCWLGFCKWK
eukprot:c22524_g1_i1 orf=530-1516(-)